MGTAQNAGYCRQCDAPVMITARTPNHLLHLALSVVTGGTWLIVWGWLLISGKTWRCSVCGAKARKR